jgi:hypothetical protein
MPYPIRTRLRLVIAVVSAVLVASTGISLGVFQTAGSASTSSPAGTVGYTPSTAPVPSVTPFTSVPLSTLASVPLSTPGGTIQAVIYDGANTNDGGSSSQTLTGFTVPSSPFTADATAIVADGQLPGNSFTFAGTGTPLSDSNAFPGADPHPAGWSFGGLWDTDSFNVTSTVNAGNTSVSDTETGDEDCITSVAQVFATGPSAAFANAGYVAAGAGLRDQGSGNITISGIPAGASVAKAYLIWANINPTDPGEAMSINGNSVTGSTNGTDGSPCWENGNIYTHSADVTPFVTGNGTYSLSGYQTGNTGGGDPWDTSEVAPLMEGASLVVLYNKTVSYSTYMELRNRDSVRCLYANQGTVNSNNPATQLLDCSHGSNQGWEFETNGTIVNQANGRCLNADPGTINANGTTVNQSACSDRENQQWSLNANGTLVNQASGRCLDANIGTINSNGTKVQLWDCNGGRNQSWYQASAQSLPSTTSYQYCPSLKPAISGTDLAGYKLCLTVSDAYDKTSAAPRSIQAPNCGDPVNHMYSDAYCRVMTTGSVWNGTANVDYANVNVTWENTVIVPLGDEVSCTVYTETDSDIMEVVTSPSGSRTETEYVVSVPSFSTRGCG